MRNSYKSYNERQNRIRINTYRGAEEKYSLIPKSLAC